MQRREFGDLVIDKGTRLCSLRGEAIHLTDTEFLLLELLGRSRRNIVTRKELMQRVFDRQLSPLDRSIDAHVSNLRENWDRTTMEPNAFAAFAMWDLFTRGP